MIVIIILNDVFPPEFVAVIVYPAVTAATVGVPEITPVVVFNTSPEGNAGLTLYDVTVHKIVGFNCVIAVPTV